MCSHMIAICMRRLSIQQNSTMKMVYLLLSNIKMVSFFYQLVITKILENFSLKEPNTRTYIATNHQRVRFIYDVTDEILGFGNTAHCFNTMSNA